ncbi:hypothetical protein KIPB_001652, partial [Kipferlia bialata]
TCVCIHIYALDLATEAGFTVVAGASFIGEHSFHTPDIPMGQDRPDAKDHAKILECATLIASKIEGGDRTQPTLPGDRPYKHNNPQPPRTALYIEDNCGSCGACVEACPFSIIGEDFRVPEHLLSQCTKCCSCVKACPSGARTFSMPPAKAEMIRLKCGDYQRREPLWYL